MLRFFYPLRSLLLFSAAVMLPGCMLAPKSATLATPPAIQQRAIAAPVAKAAALPAAASASGSDVAAKTLVATAAPDTAAACPAGSQSVAAVTALDPAFTSAQVNVTYYATGDGQGTAVPCINAMPARENTATSSGVPPPQ